MKLEELLVYYGKITQDDLNNVLKKRRNRSDNLIQILIDEGLITDNDIIEVLERKLGIPSVNLDEHALDPDIVNLIPENLARRYEIIAIDQKDGFLYVAMTDPLDIYAIDDVKLYTNCKIQPVISTRESILRSIDKLYKKQQMDIVSKEISEYYEINKNEDIDNQNSEVNRAPIVKLLNSIIQQAIEMRASDIHIEPFADYLRIRYRIDGDLKEIMRLSKSIHSPLITRIKIIGQMDIAEKRLPQDGRVENRISNKIIDMRISTMPTIYGEKVVLRLLDRENFLLTKSEIGFTEKNYECFNKLIHQPYGMILLTGPAGSGKTTTLYAIIRELNSIEKNIITIEDPVEYKLNGINQIQINPKAGLNFANGLRSILRQDPDIIMIGEIRDSETAQIAIRAAITGHLVLTTLHTNDCPSSITRLVDMGIEPYLVSSAVIGVISQRLVKRLCEYCKVAYEASYSEKILLGVDPDKEVVLYRAKGCSLCNNGYFGRIAVHEVMIVNEEMRKLINERVNTDELRKCAINSGMTTIMNNLIELVLKGVSSIEEILKVCFILEREESSGYNKFI